ncbi:opioid growth factor receptor-related protein [Pleionea sediminis]|uniref:opioid growth factor receptor-related protein n=1 Tax=Pleionea sediminis TaxID=2569479 RepID=UPI001185EAFD|nr:opioid growth factor receptor-related protein [Pleionea sediminis]
MESLSKQWLSFYMRQGTDHKQRTLVDLWTLTFDELENDSECIEWLFPQADSQPVPDHLPSLTPELIMKVYQTPEIQNNILHSFDTLAAFWGFTRLEDNTINRTAHFETQSKKWCCQDNHNQDRISRMLKCLTAIGHAELAAQTCEFLLAEIDHAGFSFSQLAIVPDWMNAVEADDELELTIEDFEASA